LRVGLAGYGGWTREAYVPAIQRAGSADIVAAAALSSATRERIGTELGSEVRLYTGFEGLLEDPSLDAVFLALPDNQHEAAILTAIDSGKPFFYEPPVAESLDRIRPVLGRLLAAPQITQADMELRFIPVVNRAAQLVAEGAIGEPRTASIRMRASWQPAPDSQISLMHSLVAWYVDALDRVVGRSAERVLVQDGRGTPGRMQGYTLAQLDYGGIWGTFDASITSACSEPETQIEVCGEDGDLVEDLFTGELKLRTKAESQWRSELVPALQPHVGWPGMHECVSDFLDAVANGGSTGADTAALAQAHLVGLAGEASIDSGTWVQVERVEDLVQRG
jgi:predicted dehydrogenase